MKSKIYKQLFYNKSVLLLALFLMTSVGMMGQYLTNDNGNGMYLDNGNASNAAAAGYQLITNYPNLKIINPNATATDFVVIGSEYSFYPRFNSGKMSYVSKLNKATTPSIISTGNTAVRMYVNDWYLVRSVGRYKGQQIDMKITLVAVFDKNDVLYPAGYLNQAYLATTTKDNFLYIRNISPSEGRAKLKYEFFVAGTSTSANNYTGTPINVAGFWNAYRLNYFKGLSFEGVKDLYVKKVNNYALYYKIPASYPQTVYIAGTVSGEGDETYATTTFDATSGFYRMIQFNRSGTGYTRYDSDALTKIAMSEASIEGHETDYKAASFQIDQAIPPIATGQTAQMYRYSNYSITTKIPSFFTNSQPTITIANTADTDISNRFTIGNIDSSYKIKISANATAFDPTNSLNLYDQEIMFKVAGVIDETKREGVDGWGQYLSNDYIVYPMDLNFISTSVDGGTFSSSNTSTMRIYFPTPTGTAVGQVIDKVNTTTNTAAKIKTVLTSQAFLKTTVTGLKERNGNANWTENTIEVVKDASGNISLEDNLDDIGLFILKVRVTSTISGEYIDIDVPITIKDSTVTIVGDIALTAQDFVEYNIAGVPNVGALEVDGVTSSRDAYVLSKTVAKSWNIKTGANLTSNITVKSDGNFKTTTPIPAGSEFTYVLTVSSAQTANPEKSVKGTFYSSNVTMSGDNLLCENQNILLTASFDDDNSKTFKWYYRDPVTSVETDLGITGKVYEKTGASNTDSGYYIAKLAVQDNIVKEIYVSVAPTEMYWSPTATNQNWNDINNWTNAGLTTKLNCVPASCTNVYIISSTNYPNLFSTIVPTEGTLYGANSVYGLGKATAKKISFANKTMMQYTNLLTYEDVAVSTDAKPENTWTMITMPISEVAAGDNLLDDSAGRHVYFRPLVNGSYYRSHTVGLNDKMKIEIPYLFYVDNKVAQASTIMSFPANKTSADYIEKAPLGLNDKKTVTAISRNISKFIIETGTGYTSTAGSFTVTYLASGGYAVINNPFIANLDVAKFITANTAVLENTVATNPANCLELDLNGVEDGLAVQHWVLKANPSMDSTNPTVISPFQSFVVKLKVASAANVSLTYSPDMTTQDQ